MGISGTEMLKNEKLQGKTAKSNRGNLTDLFLWNRRQAKLTHRRQSGILTLL
jgi:hypothetical protein